MQPKSDVPLKANILCNKVQDRAVREGMRVLQVQSMSGVVNDDSLEITCCWEVWP